MHEGTHSRQAQGDAEAQAAELFRITEVTTVPGAESGAACSISLESGAACSIGLEPGASCAAGPILEAVAAPRA
jgi:hypothetical protein